MFLVLLYVIDQSCKELLVLRSSRVTVLSLRGETNLTDLIKLLHLRNLSDSSYDWISCCYRQNRSNSFHESHSFETNLPGRVKSLLDHSKPSKKKKIIGPVVRPNSLPKLRYTSSY